MNIKAKKNSFFRNVNVLNDYKYLHFHFWSITYIHQYIFFF